MMSYKIRTVFKGCYQDINLPASASLVDVKAAIASTFDISEGENSLYLTYRNSYGREVSFDGDSEVVIFLRLCGDRLEVEVDLDDAVKDGSCMNLEVRSLHSQRSKTDCGNSVGPEPSRPGEEVSPTVPQQEVDDSIRLLKLRPRRVVAKRLCPRKHLEDEEAPTLLCHSRGEKKPFYEHNQKLRDSEGFGDDAGNSRPLGDNFSRNRKTRDSDNTGRDKDNRYLDEKRTAARHSMDTALIADKVERRPGNVDPTVTPGHVTAPQE